MNSDEINELYTLLENIAGGEEFEHIKEYILNYWFVSPIPSAIDQYIAHLLEGVNSNEVSIGTLNTYKTFFGVFKEYLVIFKYTNLRLHKIPILFDHFVSYRENQTEKVISEATSSKYAYMFNGLLAFAYENELSPYLFKMPTMHKTEEGVPKYLSSNQLKEILSAAAVVRNGIMYRIVVRFLYETGCTIKELVSIQSCDIKTETNEVLIRSVARYAERILPISKSLMDEICQYIDIRLIKDDDYIFANYESRRPYSPDNIQIKLRDIFRQIKLEGHTSLSFRDSYAINLVMDGLTIDQLVNILGMTDPTRAVRYKLFYERNMEWLNEEKMSK